MENKKTIVIFTIILLLCIGFLSIIPNNHIPIKEKINSNEKIYRYNNETIIGLTFQNKTIYMYANNFTIINNYIPEITPLIVINPDVSYYNDFYINTYCHVPSKNLPINPNFKNINSGQFLSKITFHDYNTTNNFNFSAPEYFGIGNGITVSSNINLNTFSVNFIPNFYYYFNKTSSGYQLISNSGNFQFSTPFLNGFGNNTIINENVVFSASSFTGYYNTNIINYIGNGNLTVKNTSGYSNTITDNIGENISFLLKNGSYSLSLEYKYNGSNEYYNKSFNVSGKNLTIILQNYSPYYQFIPIMFIIFNILSIVIFFYFIKNYIGIVPIQALFFIVGYLMNIQYYTFYIISIFILLISLIVTLNIVNRIGD